ncbi:MAG: hypothetical protein KFB96_00080 [Thiocapsa sp.]|nr:MAG: hypothetical protein KFB96_00080 [Thiocapsa sp.]
MLADHSNERLTQELAVQGGLMLVDLFAEEPGSRKHEVLRGALGIGAKCGLLLPYSRTHEREAARIGRDLMAQAGFDPVPALRSGGTWPPPAGSAVGLPLPPPTTRAWRSWTRAWSRPSRSIGRPVPRGVSRSVCRSEEDVGHPVPSRTPSKPRPERDAHFRVSSKVGESTTLSGGRGLKFYIF